VERDIDRVTIANSVVLTLGMLVLPAAVWTATVMATRTRMPLIVMTSPSPSDAFVYQIEDVDGEPIAGPFETIEAARLSLVGLNYGRVRTWTVEETFAAR
jgi:hypothetical protein